MRGNLYERPFGKKKKLWEIGQKTTKVEGDCQGGQCSRRKRGRVRGRGGRGKGRNETYGEIPTKMGGEKIGEYLEKEPGAKKPNFGMGEGGRHLKKMISIGVGGEKKKHLKRTSPGKGESALIGGGKSKTAKTGSNLSPPRIPSGEGGRV